MKQVYVLQVSNQCLLKINTADAPQEINQTLPLARDNVTSNSNGTIGANL